MAAPDVPTIAHGLLPRLGLFSATALIAGSMIGSGIFISPSIMAETVPTPGLLLALWLFAGLFTILGAISCGELAAMFPHAGGQYVFLREAFGPLCGFLYGWTVFLVIQTGFNAAVSIAFAKYLGVFIPALSEANILWHVDLPADLLFELSSAQLVACGVIILLTGINMCGVREGAAVQNLFTVLKVGALAALAVAGLAFGNVAADQPILPATGLTGAVIAGLAVPLSKALFAFDAWNSATFVAEEIRQPERNLPRALLLGTFGVTLIYVVTNMAYLAVIPYERLGQIPENRVAQEVAETVFGPRGAVLVIIAILISTFGCVNGLILSGARVFFAMAREGLFFRACAAVHPRTQVPIMALLFQGVWSCVLTLTGSFDALLTYTVFASVLFGALTVVALFVLRTTQPTRPRPYRCWGYPVTPLLYLLIAVPIVGYLIAKAPREAGIGVALIFSGMPVYQMLRRESRG